MKILKKDKQQMFPGLLKHNQSPAPPPAAACSPDRSSNTPPALPTIPRGHLVVGPKDQLCLLSPVGSSAASNHCATARISAAKHSGRAPPAASALSEEDDGGGGAKVKKKRKKKEKEREKAERERTDSKAKKRKEQHEGMVLTLRRSKELKDHTEQNHRQTKGKDGRSDSGTPQGKGGNKNIPSLASGLGSTPDSVKVPGKRGRKPKIKVLLPPGPSNPGPPAQHHGAKTTQNHGRNQNQASSNTATYIMAKPRGRRPRERTAAPPEKKKKKGKRRNQDAAVTEGLDRDDSTSAVAVGGEDSQDPLDNAKRRSGRQVKRRKYNEDMDFKVVDDDGETIAVLGAGRISALNATALAWQAEMQNRDRR